MTTDMHDPEKFGALSEDEQGIIRLLRNKRHEGAAERIAQIVAPDDPKDDDLPPGRLAGNEFSAEEEIAYFVFGKLMLEGVWTRRQIHTSPTHEVIVDVMAKAIREAIITFSADRATDLVTLVRYADPEITRREVDQAYAAGRLP